MRTDRGDQHPPGETSHETHVERDCLAANLGFKAKRPETTTKSLDALSQPVLVAGCYRPCAVSQVASSAPIGSIGVPSADVAPRRRSRLTAGPRQSD